MLCLVWLASVARSTSRAGLAISFAIWRFRAPAQRARAPVWRPRLVPPVSVWWVAGDRTGSTARDWLTLYELHGFDGLKPAARSDAGSSRTLAASVQALLLELRAARPRASVGRAFPRRPRARAPSARDASRGVMRRIDTSPTMPLPSRRPRPPSSSSPNMYSMWPRS